MVPRDPTHGSSGSYRGLSPQSRCAAGLARDSAAAAATLERRARLRGKSESAAPSSGNVRRVSELPGAGAAAEEDCSPLECARCRQEFEINWEEGNGVN